MITRHPNFPNTLGHASKKTELVNILVNNRTPNILIAPEITKPIVIHAVGSVNVVRDILTGMPLFDRLSSQMVLEEGNVLIGFVQSELKC